MEFKLLDSRNRKYVTRSMCQWQKQLCMHEFCQPSTTHISYCCTQQLWIELIFMGQHQKCFWYFMSNLFFLSTLFFKPNHSISTHDRIMQSNYFEWPCHSCYTMVKSHSVNNQHSEISSMLKCPEWELKVHFYCEHQKHWGHLQLVSIRVHFNRSECGSFK